MSSINNSARSFFMIFCFGFSIFCCCTMEHSLRFTFHLSLSLKFFCFSVGKRAVFGILAMFERTIHCAVWFSSFFFLSFCFCLWHWLGFFFFCFYDVCCAVLEWCCCSLMHRNNRHYHIGSFYSFALTYIRSCCCFCFVPFSFYMSSCFFFSFNTRTIHTNANMEQQQQKKILFFM